ncbi:MAG: hypothetical protein ACOX9E_07090 [Lentisphaeria bacterium]
MGELVNKTGKYTKLLGENSAFSLSGTESLYYNDEHLVQVKLVGFRESYTFFHYPDIQALLVQPTSWFQRLFGTVFVLILLTALFFHLPLPYYLMFFGWPLLIGEFFLFLCIVIGTPRFHVYIQTAVQTTRLRNVIHRGQLRKLSAFLDSRCGGALTVDSVSAPGANSGAEPAAAATAAPDSAAIATAADSPSAPAAADAPAAATPVEPGSDSGGNG